MQRFSLYLHYSCFRHRWVLEAQSSMGVLGHAAPGNRTLLNAISCIPCTGIGSPGMSFKALKIAHKKWNVSFGNYNYQLAVVVPGAGENGQLNRNNCERFQPRSHFISRLAMIVVVNIILKRTVVVDTEWYFDNLCGSHLHVSWWYQTLVVDLIG